MTRKQMIAYMGLLALVAAAFCGNRAWGKDILPMSSELKPENCVDYALLPVEYAAAMRAVEAKFSGGCREGEAQLRFTPPAQMDDGEISLVSYLNHNPIIVVGKTAAEVAASTVKEVGRRVGAFSQRRNGIRVAVDVVERGESSCVVDNPPFVRDFVAERLRALGYEVVTESPKRVRVLIAWAVDASGSCQAQRVIWDAYNGKSLRGTLMQTIPDADEFERGLDSFAGLFAMR